MADVLIAEALDGRRAWTTVRGHLIELKPEVWCQKDSLFAIATRELSAEDAEEWKTANDVAKFQILAKNGYIIAGTNAYRKLLSLAHG